MDTSGIVKASLVELGLKEGATLSDIRAEYLDLTSKRKFQCILGPDEEILQLEFVKLYKAYVTLLKEYARDVGADDMSLYPADQVFRFHFNQGVYFFINQNYIKAGEKFQEAYKIMPADELLLIYLGVLLLKRKSYYAAEKYFKEAVKLDKNNDEAWFYLADSYYKAGELRKALSMFETAKTINPSRKEIAYKIKEIKEKMGGKQSGSVRDSFLGRIIKKLTGQ